MRFATAVSLSGLLAPALGASIFTGKAPAVVIKEGLKVPGESPLEFCNADRDADLIQIDKVDLAPNPPQAGKGLDITASGEIKQTIGRGAYVKLVVKYGLIQLLSTTADLCEQIGNVDLSCPLEPGKLTLTKSVDLPSAIPPGTYTVLADVYSADDEQVTCLKATVNFPRPGAIFDVEL